MSAGLHLRRAAPDDLDAIVALKLRLRMRADPGDAGAPSPAADAAPAAPPDAAADVPAVG